MTPAPSDREPRTFWLYEGDLDFDLEWKKILAAEFPRHVSKTECIKVVEVIPGHVPPEVRHAYYGLIEAKACIETSLKEPETYFAHKPILIGIAALEAAYPALKGPKE